MTSNLLVVTRETNTELQNVEVQNALLATVFKDFPLPLMKQAVMDGVLRGFELKNFLEKDVYAIKYGNTYSLVTSVDYARKTAMRAGLAGKSAPEYEVNNKGEIIACSVTVNRIVSGHVANFTAKVYFKEYNTGKNQWATKPRTMIAKVAEMHALRMACPEELSKAYVEEEMIQEKAVVIPTVSEVDLQESKTRLESAKSLPELKTIFSSLPIQMKKELEGVKNEMKNLLTPIQVEAKVIEAKEVLETVQILSEEEEGDIK